MCRCVAYVWVCVLETAVKCGMRAEARRTAKTLERTLMCVTLVNGSPGKAITQSIGVKTDYPRRYIYR